MAERFPDLKNGEIIMLNENYKQIYGKSPIADLYDFRFTHAKRLLDNGFSINYILKTCGFKSPQHFSLLLRTDMLCRIIRRYQIHRGRFRKNRTAAGIKKRHTVFIIVKNPVWPSGFKIYFHNNIRNLMQNAFCHQNHYNNLDIKIAVLGPFVLESQSNKEYYTQFRKGVEERAAASSSFSFMILSKNFSHHSRAISSCPAEVELKRRLY